MKFVARILTGFILIIFTIRLFSYQSEYKYVWELVTARMPWTEISCPKVYYSPRYSVTTLFRVRISTVVMQPKVICVYIDMTRSSSVSVSLQDIKSQRLYKWATIPWPAKQVKWKITRTRNATTKIFDVTNIEKLDYIWFRPKGYQRYYIEFSFRSDGFSFPAYNFCEQTSSIPICYQLYIFLPNGDLAILEDLEY